MPLPPIRKPCCLEGTVFAYGATGAGKTYTMSGREQVLGPGRGPSGRLRPANRGKPPPAGVSDGTEGLVPRSMRYLFQQISALPSAVTMRMRASFYEIYNEVVYDLLTQRNRRPLQVLAAHYCCSSPHAPRKERMRCRMGPHPLRWSTLV